MFGRLVQKELLQHLLDFRFLAVFAICVLLSALSIYVGSRDYARRLEEYNAVSETNRRVLHKAWLDPGSMYQLLWVGYRWNRRPETLSPVIYGLSGALGQEVNIQHLRPPLFEASTFETDPIHALFEVLALSPEVRLQGEDWGRMAALIGIFVLYLAVFAAFGLWISALTHRRRVAFLGLLVLWTVWIFVVPALAMEAARRFSPAQGAHDLYRQSSALRWEIVTGQMAETQDYFKRNRVEDWDALSAVEQENVQEVQRNALDRINSKWDAEYHARLGDLRMKRRNEERRQQGLAVALSAFSPLSAVSFASMDLAQTGFVQQERIEDALNAYLIYLSDFIQEKERTGIRDFYSGTNLKDITLFAYQNQESVGACLSRNTFHILNLALLAVLGFVGAYVAILRYDVR